MGGMRLVISHLREKVFLGAGRAKQEEGQARRGWDKQMHPQPDCIPHVRIESPTRASVI